MVYTFHVDPDAARIDDAVAIKEGFSWLAFLFDALWLLYYRLWFWLLAILVLGAALNFASEERMIDPASAAAALVALKLLIGFQANDWRRRGLERRGYRLAGIATGADLESAERRFFESWRQGARRAAAAPAGP
jgi:hypothetical protein